MNDDKNMAKSEDVREGGRTNTDAALDVDGQPLPVVTFSTFVLSIASSALVHLGEVPDPDSGQIKQSLDVAKHNIDILNMLKEKSVGNLDVDETRLIEGILYELRLKYVMADK